MSRKVWLMYIEKSKLGSVKAISFNSMEEVESYMTEHKEKLNYLDIAKSIQNVC